VPIEPEIAKKFKMLDSESISVDYIIACGLIFLITQKIIKK